MFFVPTAVRQESLNIAVIVSHQHVFTTVTIIEFLFTSSNMNIYKSSNFSSVEHYDIFSLFNFHPRIFNTNVSHLLQNGFIFVSTLFDHDNNTFVQRGASLWCLGLGLQSSKKWREKKGRAKTDVLVQQRDRSMRGIHVPRCWRKPKQASVSKHSKRLASDFQTSVQRNEWDLEPEETCSLIVSYINLLKIGQKNANNYIQMVLLW